jgi:hypothetical protein|tara:strand:+ start:47295 stop:47846 length:552 start_codon:yes stop_codon:yes gene_type:complete
LLKAKYNLGSDNIIMDDTLEDGLRYDRMVEKALRSVVKTVVEEVIERDGLPGEHHFYITFNTDYPGVQIPEYLAERYPGEMTIVLQYQFYDLKVDDEKLEVTLSFNSVPEHLIIPLPSISIFADPSVNFALQFQPLSDEDETGFDPDDDPERIDVTQSVEDKTNADDAGAGEVISLDQFRKKD